MQVVLSKLAVGSYFKDVPFRLTALLMTGLLLFTALLGGPVTVLCVGRGGHIEIEAASVSSRMQVAESCCGHREEPKADDACGDCVDIGLRLAEGRVQENLGEEFLDATPIWPICCGRCDAVQFETRPVALRFADRALHRPPLIESWSTIRLLI